MLPPDDSSQPQAPDARTSAPPSLPAAIFFDLRTRDGRRSVEVRSLTTIANGFYASPRATLYSCAYESQSERLAAIGRARRFCDAQGIKVVHFAPAAGRRAAWQ